MAEPWVGIIANPVSARDIRRVIANAASLQITDRANIVLRVLACLKACGIQRRDDDAGDRRHPRSCEARPRRARPIWARCEFPELCTIVDMPVTGDGGGHAGAPRGHVRRRASSAIVVLGGDGTHRAVASALRHGADRRHLHRHQQRLSRASRAHDHGARRRPRRHRPHPGRASPSRPTSASIVSVNEGAVQEIALVDVAIVTERYVGARALWRTETFRELLRHLRRSRGDRACRPSPGCWSRSRAREPGGLAGLHVPARRGAAGAACAHRPRLSCATSAFSAGAACRPASRTGPAIAAGSIALDGERELSFSERDRVVIDLEEGALHAPSTSAPACTTRRATASCIRTASRR